MAIKPLIVATHTHESLPTDADPVPVPAPAHAANHETAGSDALAHLAAPVIDSGTLDGDRLPAISATKKGAVPATGTVAGHFLRDTAAFVDLITFGTPPASPYDGELTQNLGTTGASGKFAMQLRELKQYALYDPLIQYSKPTAASIKCLSTAASLGGGFVFVSLPKAYVHNKKVKLTWETWDDHPSHTFAFYARIYDGSYLRSSSTDFIEGIQPGIAIKGAGLLQTIEDLTGINASHTKTITTNLTASTQTHVTIMIWVQEGSSYQGYFTISSLQITDLSDVLEYEADFAGALNMERTGSTSDYGLIGTDAIGTNPDRTLKAWDEANSRWNNLAEPYILGGFDNQYRRGDKTWQTLNASAVINTPAGSIAAVTVQAALNELDTEKFTNNVSAADKILGRVTAGAGVVEEIACTAAGRALLDDATAAAQATTLGLGITDSPVFFTVKLSGLTDGYVPYHVSDAAGLANSLIFTDGANIGINLDKTGTAPQKLLDLSGNINITKVAECPKTFTLTGTTGGALDDGAIYNYSFVYVTADGSTSGDDPYGLAITLAAGQNAVNITNIPVPTDPRITSKKLYRTNGGQANYRRWFLTTVPLADTTYSDILADSELSITDTTFKKDNTTVKGLYVDNSLFAFAGLSNASYGANALSSITNGGYNSAFGTNALNALTTGSNNIGIGIGAFQQLITGSSNIGIGYRAGWNNNNSGSSNIFIGDSAGTLSASGNTIGNTAVGWGALAYGANGFDYNSAFGYRAGYNFRGDYNIFIGANTGNLAAAATIGNYNILIGDNVGDNATTGAAGNILIGKQLDLPVANGVNQLSIGNLIFGTGLDGTGTTVSAGKIGICVVNPLAKLHLPASAAAAGLASMKIDPGIVATTPVSGNIESDGTHLYWTDSGGTRRQLDN